VLQKTAHEGLLGFDVVSFEAPDMLGHGAVQRRIDRQVRSERLPVVRREIPAPEPGPEERKSAGSREILSIQGMKHGHAAQRDLQIHVRMRLQPVGGQRVQGRLILRAGAEDLVGQEQAQPQR